MRRECHTPDFSRLGALLPRCVGRFLNVSHADRAQGAVKEAGQSHQRGCARCRTSGLSPTPLELIFNISFR